MFLFQVFIVGFAFSFIGSIPPGTLNISVIQLALNNNFKAALRFAAAAALIEFPYALIAIRFESLITSSPYIIANFSILAAVVMIILGIINLWNSGTPSNKPRKLEASGFRKGVLLSILNPLSIPFWIGVTAYIRSIGWVSFPSSAFEYCYVLGISTGTLVLLSLLAILARRVATIFQQSLWLKRLPGFVFLILGLYALIQYVLE